MEELKSLREQFIASHPQYLGLDEKFNSEVNSFYANNISHFDYSTATCNIASGYYYFPSIISSHSSIITKRTYSFADFAELIHPNDRMHYAEAMRLAYSAIQDKLIDDITMMKLLFECRIRNEEGIFSRINIIAHILSPNKNVNTGIIVLYFKSLWSEEDMIDGVSKAIYIIDMSTNKRLLQNNIDCLTPLEQEAARLYLYRKRGDNLAEKMSISNYTKWKLFKSIKQKTKYKSIGFAVLYLCRKGLIY